MEHVSLTLALSVLGGLVLAGQWLQTNGGLPAAVTSGKFAAGRLQQLLR